MKVKIQWVSFYPPPPPPPLRYMFHGGTNFGYWNGESRSSLGQKGGCKEIESEVWLD